MARIIAIDYGMKRVGIAMTDVRQTLAMPFKTAKGSKDLNLAVKSVLETLKDHIEEIEEVLVGLPLLLSGKEGDMALLVKKFAALLEGKMNIKVTLWDERLSSGHATAMFKEIGMSRKKRSTVLDEAAASLLLQSYLDCKQSTM